MAEGLEAVFFKRAGVGLHGDFAVRLHAQARAQAANQAVDTLRAEQAGRAATNEHAVHGAPPDQRQAGFQIGHQRIDVALLRHTTFVAGRAARAS